MPSEIKTKYLKLQSALVALKISLTDLSKFIFEKETDQPIGFCVLDLLQNNFFQLRSATSLLVTMLETKCLGDSFGMLVTNILEKSPT